jgi:S-adenosylmethionine decarboxylase proenzyme
MNGTQRLADFYQCACDDALLQHVAALQTLCLTACQHAGVTVVAHAFHQFLDGGATGAVVLAESHLAVHTWPELRAVTLDIYVCNYRQDNTERVQMLYEFLHDAFLPQRVETQRILRGKVYAGMNAA